MGEKELTKKFIQIMDLIIQRESMYPEPKNSNWDDPNNAWDINNTVFNMKSEVFINFLLNLQKMGILKTQSGQYIPEFAGEKKKIAYDEDGEIINSEEFVIFYRCINLKKAKKHKEALESLLPNEEISKIKSVSKITREPILKEAGHLNVRSSGNICYKDNIIDMRIGLKTLCELFIDRPGQLINRDDIYDKLDPDTGKKKSTIAKYVSELRNILKPYFKRQTIVNHKKDGWIFFPEAKKKCSINED